MNNCPCGSGQDMDECCLPVIKGEQMPQSPEQLMRSRYTAYVLGNAGYLYRTWHSSTRPAQLNPDGIKWTGLKVVAAEDSQVEFIARYISNGMQGSMHERSRFVYENAQWFYVDGEQLPVEPEKSFKKPGRNDPCFCGSGKKYKKCCG